jgi:hypothetical protein
VGSTPDRNSSRQVLVNSKSFGPKLTDCGEGRTVYPRANNGEAVAPYAEFPAIKAGKIPADQLSSSDRLQSEHVFILFVVSFSPSIFETGLADI